MAVNNSEHDLRSTLEAPSRTLPSSETMFSEATLQKAEAISAPYCEEMTKEGDLIFVGQPVQPSTSPSAEVYYDVSPMTIFERRTAKKKKSDPSLVPLFARDKEHEGMTDCQVFLADEKGAAEAGGLYHWRWKVGKVMESARARCFFISLVFINAVMIGVRMDYGGDEATWDTVEHIFLSMFLGEVSLRLFAFGLLFFADAWNWIDFIVVFLGVLDWLFLAIGSEGAGSAFTAMRLIRVFRIIRLFGFFDRLSRLVEAFIGAMKDVVWVAMLLLIMLYIYAILTTSFYGDSQQLKEAGVDGNAYFGTIPRSMASLFQIMTMDSWISNITRPVAEVHSSAWFVLILWCCVGSLGLLNLMTAIFIDSLTELSRQESVKQKVKAQKRRTKALKIVEKLFLDFDVNHDGSLDHDEMQEVIKEMARNTEIIDTFVACGITNVEIEEALTIADMNTDGIQYEEFINALNIMDDKAQKKDTMRITKQICHLEVEVQGLKEQVEKLAGVIAAKFGTCTCTLDPQRIATEHWKPGLQRTAAAAI